MAGHSKWANIKHKKARNDAKRGRVWSKCARAIIVAAKNGGGDPGSNLTLRYAIDDAKAENMPMDTIANAIKKGTGELGGAHYDTVVYEGYSRGGVAVMLDVLTDNRNRTAADVRKIFERFGGNLGSTGCVSYIFHPKGQVFVAKAGVDEDTLMTVALDAGALDVADEDEVWLVVTEPGDFIAVRDAIRDAELTLESAQLTMVPDTSVACTGKDAVKVLGLVEEFEDHEDVQKVYANFDIPDEELAQLQS